MQNSYSQKGSPAYLFSIVLAAVVGGLLFGYDTAVISGAEKGLQAFFMGAGDFTYTNFMHGFTTSSALIGCVIGSALSGIFASRLGRRRSLFIAGILPGIMMAVLCLITIVILVKTCPGMAPGGQRYSWKERLVALKGLIGAVILFGTVLGGMFSGIFSVSQASAIGAFLAWGIMAVNLAIHREFSWKALWEKTKEGMWTTIRTFSMTFLIIIGADIFCKFLTITNIPISLANYIGGLHVSRYVILALMTLVYLFLGMIMDELPMIMLTVPIFWPIAQALGFDVIWFGVYVILTMELGAISPPVGLNCFIISGIAKDVPLSTIYKGALPFMLTVFVGIALLAAFPQIALALPGLMN